MPPAHSAFACDHCSQVRGQQGACLSPIALCPRCMPACAPLRLTDTSLPAQSLRLLRRPGSSLLQWGAGLLACAQSMAGLQLSCCAPAGSSPAQLTAVQVGRAYARPAVQPSPRCAPAVPLPARPACAAARTRTSTLPVPPHHRPICPLVSQLTHPCAHVRAGLDEGFRTRCCTSSG